VVNQNGPSFDAIIVGAGPAGSSLAIRLANAGKRILLVEKSQFPRHKMCGEFVSPECIDYFEELDVTDPIQHGSPPELLETCFYTQRGRPLTIPNRWLSRSHRNAIGISRSLLDNLLMKKARDCGVVVSELSEALSPIVEMGRLTGLKVRSESGDVVNVRTLVAIDASGRAQSLARHFQPVSSRSRADVVAFKTHLSNAKIEKDVCEIYSFRGGYGGCSEIENGKFNLCFVMSSSQVRAIGNDRQSILENGVLKNTRAKKVLSDIEPSDLWLTVAIPRFGRSESCPYPGVFAVGDAAGFIDPFTGSGIALALQTAKLCAASILQNCDARSAAQSYSQSYLKAVSKRMMFCKIVRVATGAPFIADSVIDILSLSPLFGKLVAKATRAGN